MTAAYLARLAATEDLLARIDTLVDDYPLDRAFTCNDWLCSMVTRSFTTEQLTRYDHGRTITCGHCNNGHLEDLGQAVAA